MRVAASRRRCRVQTHVANNCDAFVVIKLSFVSLQTHRQLRTTCFRLLLTMAAYLVSTEAAMLRHVRHSPLCLFDPVPLSTGAAYEVDQQARPYPS